MSRRRRLQEIQDFLQPVEAELTVLQREVDEAEDALQVALAAVAGATWNAPDQWKDANVDEIRRVLEWKAHFASGGDTLHTPHPHLTSMHKRQQLPESSDASPAARPISPVAWAAALVSDLIVSVGRKETIKARRAASEATEVEPVRVVITNDTPALQLTEAAQAISATTPSGVSRSLLGTLDKAASLSSPATVEVQSDPIAAMLAAGGTALAEADPGPVRGVPPPMGEIPPLPDDADMTTRGRSGKRAASEAESASKISSDGEVSIRGAHYSDHIGSSVVLALVTCIS